MTVVQRPLRLLAMRPAKHPEAFLVTPERFEEARVRCGFDLPELAFEVCPVDAADLEERVAGADVLIGASVPTAAVKGNRGPLKLIQLSSAGYDHLLPLDWLPEQVSLSTASGVHAPKLREWATMTFLMLHIKVPHFVTQQRSHAWKPHLSTGIAGRKALIFGTGALGTAIARAAVDLGIEPIGVRRSETPSEPFTRVVTRPQALELMPEADFVVLATPLNDETRGIMDAECFARMKPGAGFVNVGRGGLVDQDALIAALDEGKVGGAVIDVTTPEPPPEDSPLWDVPNLIITPHISCDDPETYVPRVLDILMENLKRMVADDPLVNKVA